MTDLLRRELQRLGDEARPVSVPPDTWRRGRRARLRDRGLVAGAAALVLALVAGTAWAVLDVGRTPPVDERSTPGVPDAVWPVPSRVLATMDPDLKVGLTAAAYTTEQGDVITVAADGTYHRLLLGRLVDEAWLRTKGMTTEGTWAALSPDGQRLAYAWEMPGEGSPVPVGISVIDLMEGREESVATLRGGAGISVQDLGWSPGGRWLAWSGLVTTSWTASARAYGRAAFGRIDVSTGRSQVATTAQGTFQGTAVDDRGVVLMIDATRRLQAPPWAQPTVIDRSAPKAHDVGYAASPGGGLIMLSSAIPTKTLEIGRRAGGAPIEVDLPSDVFPEGATVRPIGWIDAARALVELDRAEGFSDSGWYTTRRSLSVVDTTARTVLIVGQLEHRDDANAIGNLTVATRLMSVERPTVDRREPDWPWSVERKALVWGLIIGVPLAALLAWRRFRRSASRLPRRTPGTS